MLIYHALKTWRRNNFGMCINILRVTLGANEIQEVQQEKISLINYKN